MSKKKGVAENKLKKGDDTYDHNIRVALWGTVSDKRYYRAREIVIGWNIAKAAEQMAEIDESTRGQMLKSIEDLRKITCDFVRDAVEKSDAEALRKMAEVIERKDHPPSVDVAILQMHLENYRYDPNHKFTFKEMREVLAKALGIPRPYEEKFDRRVRRIMRKILASTE
jgi:hypothetical protein